jgi:hypothetical protein
MEQSAEQKQICPACTGEVIGSPDRCPRCYYLLSGRIPEVEFEEE